MSDATAEIACINPDEYEPWEFEAFLDGEREVLVDGELIDLQHVAEHISKCQSCQSKRQQLEYIDKGLGAAFYRFDCPPFTDLREYFWQNLTTSAQETIANHLELCPLCSAELEQIEEFSTIDDLGIDPVEQTSVRDKATDAIGAVYRSFGLTIATLLPPQPSPGLRGPDDGTLLPSQPSLAFRGQEDGASLLYDANGILVSIITEPELDETFKLSGQVLIEIDAMEARFRLIPELEKIDASSGEIDDLGEFTITNVPKGNYQLVLNLNSQDIMVPDILIA